MFQRLTANLDGTKIRHETLEGKEYMVVPTIMLVEGVHAGTQGPLYYPKTTLARMPWAWNHKPVVIHHPTMNGEGISACAPHVVEKQRVGYIFNTEFDGRLKDETWLEKAKLRQIAPEVHNALLDGKMVEVSTGLFHEADMTPGKWQEEDYTGTVTNMVPDHLAILPDAKGACSIADGAGLLRNAEHGLSHNDVTDHLHKELNGSSDPYDAPVGYKDRAHIRDVFPKHVVYEKGGQHFKHEYKVKDGHAKLHGEPEEVHKQTSYVCANGTTIGNEDHQGPLKLPKPHIGELSDVMKKQQVQKALTEKYSGVMQEGDWGGWVTDLYANYVIWSKDGKHWRLPYTYDDDQIRFDGEPEEVERVSEYRAKKGTPIDGTISPNANQEPTMADNKKGTAVKPAANAMHAGAHDLMHDPSHADAHEGDSSKSDGETRTAHRKEAVNKMISGGGWGEEDRKFLEGLPDDHFAKVESYTARGYSQPIIPYSYEGIGDRSSVHGNASTMHNQQQITADQYINNAPAEVRELLRSSLKAHKSQKAALVAAIVANKSNRFNPTWLEGLDISVLEGMVQLAGQQVTVANGPNFAGQAAGVPMFIPDTTQNQQAAPPEALKLPTMNWDDEKKKAV